MEISTLSFDRPRQWDGMRAVFVAQRGPQRGHKPCKSFLLSSLQSIDVPNVRFGSIGTNLPADFSKLVTHFQFGSSFQYVSIIRWS